MLLASRRSPETSGSRKIAVRSVVPLAALNIIGANLASAMDNIGERLATTGINSIAC